MNKNMKTSLAFAIALVLVGLGIFIHRDYKKISLNTEGVSGDASVATSTASDLDSLIKSGQVSINEVPVETSAPAPSLDRPIPTKTGLDPESEGRVLSRLESVKAELKSDPKSYSGWLDLGILRKQLGDYRGAAEAWEYVSLLYPANEVSFSNLGDLYEHFLKDYPKAEKNFLLVVRVNPARIDGYRSLYELYRLSYLAKSSEAPGALRWGLEKNPGNYELLILSAQYYRDTGNKANALKYYEQALSAAAPEMKPLVEAEIDELKQQ